MSSKKFAEHLSNQIQNIFISGDWATATCYRTILKDVDWIEANTSTKDLNSIALLIFHVNYYMEGILVVFKGGNLAIHDQYSFDMKPISNGDDWEALKSDFFRNAKDFSSAVASMNDSALKASFDDAKYGNFQKNIEGMITHSVYHLGQLALIKKNLRST